MGILRGNCRGWQLSGWELSGGQLSGLGIDRVGIVRGGIVRGVIVRGDSSRGELSGNRIITCYHLPYSLVSKIMTFWKPIHVMNVITSNYIICNFKKMDD